MPIVIVTAVPAALVNVKTPPLSLLVVRSAAVAGPAGAPAPVPVNAMLAFGAVARGLLQRLVGDRLGGIDQLLQRGDAGVGGLQHLHAVADAVEQVADVAGAGIEAGGGEEVGRVVERAVDLLAGGEAGLRGREQVGGALQREQVLANCRREGDVGQDM